MISTEHFHPDTDKKLRCTCGHSECDKRSVDQETLDKAELVRQWMSRPLIVTSGGRCPNHPDETHRTKPADHQKCIGIDVFYEGEEMKNLIMMYGVRAGFTAIAAGKNFVHLGNRKQNHLSTWRY
ncbi:hypothetical protein VA249_29880 [Vibrio alfacsensis]|uniref:D-Ala-D-Ala carboxypeptidase family metallohydrolase n=1 Tax=Vibrio alfacsensis TaxID=1074311 RepID=UPI001BF16967|nr:D-Ala-D-Ala carboxypeptidase family metallohydrolase [Vibrio alfacsensis]BBM66342.1 hypothetical protein VA249_29880 [Vibrio alfacsensis]